MDNSLLLYHQDGTAGFYFYQIEWALIRVKGPKEQRDPTRPAGATRPGLQTKATLSLCPQSLTGPVGRQNPTEAKIPQGTTGLEDRLGAVTMSFVYDKPPE